MLIISHKHNQEGWWGVSKKSVKLKKQVLMEFGGWSLPPWPKSLIVIDFLAKLAAFSLGQLTRTVNHRRRKNGAVPADTPPQRKVSAYRFTPMK